MQLSSPSATSPNQSFEESILLSPLERLRQETRKALSTFRSRTRLPCLWVTAHLPNPIPQLKIPIVQSFLTNSDHLGQSGSLSLEEIRTALATQGTADSIAGIYRVFLQKQLIRLNNKLLHYKKTGLCFHFRGTLERNADDPTGRNLHYHFSIWAPDDLFKTDPGLMVRTKDTLIAHWHRHVNNQASQRHQPIHIEIIRTQQDAINIARYEAKANPMTNAYEIFDDWSLAGCHPVPA